MFIDETLISGRFVSKHRNIRGSHYSIQVNIAGDCVFDIELQVSLDDLNWVTIKEPRDSFLSNLDESDSPIIYDQSNGHHKSVRVVIDIKSGTATSIKGYISR